MPRPIKSFSQRMADEAKDEALSTVTMTERLLAHILIELMETRVRCNLAALAARLRDVGFSQAQAAAILNTTPATLNVSRQREQAAQESR